MKVRDFFKKYTMVIALVVVFALFSWLTGGRLLQPQNMSNLMLQNGYVLVMACGMLLCILTGGNIDLSVGSVICLVGGFAATMLGKGWGTAATIFVSLIMGLLIGMWNGFWIGYMHIPPFITTLGGMFMFRGFGRVILDNKTVAISNKGFLNVFTSYVPGQMTAVIVGVIIAVVVVINTVRSRASKAKKGYRQNSIASDYIKAFVIAALVIWYSFKLKAYKGIPVMLIWVLAICLIYAFITSKTAFGRYFYAVGGNEKATQLSGIDTKKVYFIASVNGSTGNSFEMDAIGSCFIGGASAYGGSGTVGGAMIGALLLGTINMGMSIMGIGDSWQYVVKGAVLLAAVIFDVISTEGQS